MLEDYESNLLVEVKFQTSVSNHLLKRMGDQCRQTKHFLRARSALLFMVWSPHPRST